VSAGSSHAPERGWRSPPGGVRAVVAVGLLALVVVAAVVLLQQAPRRSGTNLTGDNGYPIVLGPGQQLCEPGELVPGDTGALELSATTPTATALPALALVISGPTGASLTSGQLAAGAAPGRIRIPVRTVRETTQGMVVCLRNLGNTEVAFGGSVPDQIFQIQLAGKPLYGRLRIDYLRPGSESWLALAPTLAHRFSLGKSGLVRQWAFGAVIVLMLAAIALAARTMISQERVP
jgi:hypothetical protein